MNITCYWRLCPVSQKLRPAIYSKNASQKFKGLIFYFLNDDEGLGLSFLTQWIETGLKEVEKINAGTLEFYDMWGQAWGADISKEKVLIYWDYSDTVYEESMRFECFYMILTEWSEFIKTEPSIDNVVEFDCGITLFETGFSKQYCPCNPLS